MRFEQAVSQEVHQACWRYCCRLAPDIQGAEDLLQEALVRAYLSFGQLKDPARVKGWLFSIIRSVNIDHLRKLKRMPQVAAVDPGKVLGAYDQKTPQVVISALASLPNQQRELVELFHLDELSLAETAQALGIKVNTVKQRLLRARAALKRTLHPAFESGELEELF